MKKKNTQGALFLCMESAAKQSRMCAAQCTRSSATRQYQRYTDRQQLYIIALYSPTFQVKNQTPPRLTQIDIPKGDKGEPKNFCFLHYYNPVDAHRAIGVCAIFFSDNLIFFNLFSISSPHTAERHYLQGETAAGEDEVMKQSFFFLRIYAKKKASCGQTDCQLNA